ncbi:hypothetical protein H072_8816 [Dactylellina haptotyla CBS 200.50]|uniref:Uncharacterized protein n=1 Tax=Dactylellina haptotyla (strain CBS 200.50) TaxID=1284197 RepID=S8BE40_DACHA|nr:hypothetical protein H072_8816 [Dactylellina haptotyla CBS 200.50]
MATSSGKIPRPPARTSASQMEDIIFGEEEDPTKASKKSRYQKMRLTSLKKWARKAVKDVIIKERGDDGSFWDDLPVELQQRTIEYLMQHEEFAPYFERMEDRWLPKYLVYSYMRTYHYHHRQSKGAHGMGIEEGDRSSVNAQSGPTESNKRDNQ